jgi:hypothetical protein
MSTLLVLASFLGVGIGLAAAYGATHKQRRIHFVERDNLQKELDNLEIDVKRSETCVECGEEIDPDEVGAIVQVDGEYQVVCNKLKCLDSYDLQ